MSRKPEEMMIICLRCGRRRRVVSDKFPAIVQRKCPTCDQVTNHNFCLARPLTPFQFANYVEPPFHVVPRTRE